MLTGKAASAFSFLAFGIILVVYALRTKPRQRAMLFAGIAFIASGILVYCL